MLYFQLTCSVWANARGKAEFQRSFAPSKSILFARSYLSLSVLIPVVCSAVAPVSVAENIIEISIPILKYCLGMQRSFILLDTNAECDRNVTCQKALLSNPLVTFKHTPKLGSNSPSYVACHQLPYDQCCIPSCPTVARPRAPI